MAPWGDAKLFVLLFVIACSCSVASAQIPMDCCLSVRNMAIDRRRVASYSQQTKGLGCSIDATILVTRRCRTLCVPADEPWVREVMRHVDRRREQRKKTCKNKRWARATRV